MRIRRSLLYGRAAESWRAAARLCYRLEPLGVPMDVVRGLAVFSYLFSLSLLSLLAAYRMLLAGVVFFARSARRARPVQTLQQRPGLLEKAPSIVVQLPIFNEPLVVERLIRCCAKLRYPKDRIEIQVLDDSTDDTRARVLRIVEELKTAGSPVRAIFRPDRTGFKAGALAHGLRQTDAELVAVLDADFLPAPDFLEKMVPPLIADPQLAFVQARWGHLNREQSALTRAQAVLIDAHFCIEHHARQFLGAFFNFNGSGGIWKRQAIETCGGWSTDSITEDLDLSCRAYLRGWRGLYLPDVIAEGELPDSSVAFRNQQARWTRGGIETARRYMLPFLFSEKLPLRVRVSGALHLLSGVGYALLVLLALSTTVLVFSMPNAVYESQVVSVNVPVRWRAALSFGALGIVLFYVASTILSGTPRGVRRWVDVGMALCLGAGISLSNAKEALLGLWAKNSMFVRTPKSGSMGSERNRSTPRSEKPALGSRWQIGRSRGGHNRGEMGASHWVELGVAGLLGAATAEAIQRALWFLLPMLVILLLGFGWMGSARIAPFIADGLRALRHQVTNRLPRSR